MLRVFYTLLFSEQFHSHLSALIYFGCLISWLTFSACLCLDMPTKITPRPAEGMVGVIKCIVTVANLFYYFMRNPLCHHVENIPPWAGSIFQRKLLISFVYMAQLKLWDIYWKRRLRIWWVAIPWLQLGYPLYTVPHIVHPHQETEALSLQSIKSQSSDGVTGGDCLNIQIQKH